MMGEARSETTRREGFDRNKKEEQGQNIIRGLWGACDRFYSCFSTSLPFLSFVVIKGRYRGGPMYA